MLTHGVVDQSSALERLPQIITRNVIITICDLQVKMVTGDQYAIAVETSKRLGLGTNIMEGQELLGFEASDRDFANHVETTDGFAGVFPEHKHRIVEAVQRSGRLVGMTGAGFA